jgi:hypothetical protein
MCNIFDALNLLFNLTQGMGSVQELPKMGHAWLSIGLLAREEDLCGIITLVSAALRLQCKKIMQD